MPEISVVVPVYKVENYIDRCVRSLLNQTFQDMEIILVDDGSPDTCPELCDQYAEKYERIKVIHKKNGGLSSARNAGMKAATGRYIGFVDSDDSVDNEMYQKMYQIMMHHHVDFVMSDYLRILADELSYIKTLDIDAGLYSRRKIVTDLFPSLIMGNHVDYGPLLSVWHCLYDLTFLRKNNINFDEEVRWSEDNIFSAIVGYNANSFFYMKGEGLYHYYQNPGTITTSYKQGAWDVYKTMNQHLHLYFDPVSDYDFSEQLKLHLIYYACNCISQAGKLELSETRQEIDRILNDPYMNRVFNNVKFIGISFKFRIQLMLMRCKCVKILTRLVKK